MTDERASLVELVESDQPVLESTGMRKIEARLAEIEAQAEEAPEETCNESLPLLVSMIGSDNLYLVERALQGLELLAEEPEVLVRHGATLDRLLETFSGNRDDVNRRLVCLLEPVAERRPEALSAVDATALESIISQGEYRERRAAYQLAAAIRSDPCLEILSDVWEYEHDEVKRIAEKACASSRKSN